MINNEIPVTVIRRLLDHSSTAMTDVYARISDETLKREFEKFNKRVNIHGELIPIDIVGESDFGPVLQAAVVALTARNRISRRDMSELLWELFAVRVSVGSIDRICQRTSGLLAGPHERLSSGVLGSGAVNVDETGSFLSGENRTMWTAATPHAAIFRIVEDRHRDRLQELLGSDFEGIVTSDRWWAYDLLDVEQRQACWSHLQRDFRFHSEGLAAQQIFGAAGLTLTARLFDTWHAYLEHHNHDRLAAEMTPIQTELRELLQHAADKSKRHNSSAGSRQTF